MQAVAEAIEFKSSSSLCQEEFVNWIRFVSGRRPAVANTPSKGVLLVVLVIVLVGVYHTFCELTHSIQPMFSNETRMLSRII